MTLDRSSAPVATHGGGTIPKRFDSNGRFGHPRASIADGDRPPHRQVPTDGGEADDSLLDPQETIDTLPDGPVTAFMSVSSSALMNSLTFTLPLPLSCQLPPISRLRCPSWPLLHLSGQCFA
jgi:hypothetical protein